jgi:CheY-like chemotaxis protein
MKYLITDDSSLARKMTQKVLTKFLNEDDIVFLAKNGEEAVAHYKEHTPDLCFMDLTMPVLDGFEATKQINEFDKNAKIIVITADVQQHAIDRAIENGAIDFIHKPIDEKKMFKILHKHGIL